MSVGWNNIGTVNTAGTGKIAELMEQLDIREREGSIRKTLEENTSRSLSHDSTRLLTSDYEMLGAVYDISTYLTNGPLLPPDFGCFYSSEAADSPPTSLSTEKSEGGFYVWTYNYYDRATNECRSSTSWVEGDARTLYFRYLKSGFKKYELPHIISKF